MRWFKHMTTSAQDEKLARLIAEHGMAGYGLWWRVMEIVAARVESGSDPSVSYPIATWSHLLLTRGSLVVRTLSQLAVTTLVTVERHDGDIRVTIPNILKYRDEWTRKSGVTPERLRSKEQIQNTDTDKPPIVPLPGDGFSLTSEPKKKRAKPPEMSTSQQESFSRYVAAHPKNTIQLVSARNLWREKVKDPELAEWLIAQLKRESAGDTQYILGPGKWLAEHLELYASGARPAEPTAALVIAPKANATNNLTFAERNAMIRNELFAERMKENLLRG